MEYWSTNAKHMPEKDGLYIITYKNFDSSIVTLLRFGPLPGDPSGRRCWLRKGPNGGTAAADSDKVLAWHEAPKPYTPSQTSSFVGLDQAVTHKIVKRKYILTNDTITYDGFKLHRIQAVRDIPEIGVYEGDIGGYVESERNLSQEGSCWVFDDAKVYHNAVLRDNATARGKAKIYDNAEMSEDSSAYDESQIFENAKMYGHARATRYAFIHGHSEIFEYAVVGDFSQVSDTSKIYGSARLGGKTLALAGTRIHGTKETLGGSYFGGDVG